MMFVYCETGCMVCVCVDKLVGCVCNDLRGWCTEKVVDVVYVLSS